MLPIEVAILRTILYADVFNFPLTSHELHRYLIHNRAVTYDDLQAMLQSSHILKDILQIETPYICLQGRDDIIALREEREVISTQLWQSAIRYGQWLSHIPFVEMVALTGALAVRNPSSAEDDFDYILITRPQRVWLARLCAVVMVRFVRLFGRELCPNYVLASDQLQQSRQDLYMAHEVSQMQPIYGEQLYHAMTRQNQWIFQHLPNALPYPTETDKPRRIRRILEWCLGGRIGDWLEQWEYHRKLTKFSPKIEQDQSSAEIHSGSVKGHFEDHGLPVMTRYAALLKEYGLYEQTQAMAGD
ncbi:MAG: hypothetical protein AAF846_13285 [Chloroflexota bacterium]